MKPNQKSTILIFSLPLWLLIVGIGLSSIFRYENKAGTLGEPPNEWPEHSAIQRSPDRPTLVMMVHPKCPCSRASISDLAVMMVSIQGRVDAHVVFIRPKGFAEDWEKTDLWTNAALIPGVDVSVDNEGLEAQRFRSKTSGQVMLYGTDGRLLFNGGITPARGHLGDNDGSRSLVAILTGTGSVVEQSNVFGCPLFKIEPPETPKDSCRDKQGK
jgi:hypothetical protein